MSLYSRFVLWYQHGPYTWLCVRGLRWLPSTTLLLLQWIGAELAPERRQTAADYARANGYFWLPCANCGDWIGGHEWKPVKGHQNSIPGSRVKGQGHGICRACTIAGVGDRAWAATS